MRKLHAQNMALVVILAGFMSVGIGNLIMKSLGHSKAVVDCDCKNCDIEWWNE